MEEVYTATTGAVDDVRDGGGDLGGDGSGLDDDGGSWGIEEGR